MFTVLGNERERTADRMDAAKWLADRAFGKAVQALDIDVSQYSLDITDLSTDDLKALRAIFEKYSPDVAELAEAGELRFGAGSVGAPSRQR